MTTIAGGSGVDDGVAYEVIYRWDGKKFILSLPQLGLEKDGTDLPSLHAEVLAGLDRLRVAYRDLGLPEPDFSLPPRILSSATLKLGGGDRGARRQESASAETSALAGPAASHWVRRTVVSLAIVLVFVAMMGYAITRAINHVKARIASVNPAAIARVVSTTLDKTAAAARGFTPEREQQMVDDIHVIVEKLRPFALELRQLFADPAEPTLPMKQPTAPTNEKKP